MQYLLNQIKLENDNCSLLRNIETLMEKYHIDNYKRMGIPYPLKQIIAVFN